MFLYAAVRKEDLQHRNRTMPLYARKDRYRSGDQILAFYLVYGHRNASSQGRIHIFLGEYAPTFSLRQQRKIPLIEPHWEFVWKLRGEITLRDAMGTGGLEVEASFSGKEGIANIVGITLGRLDITDWYEVRSYLKRCLIPLREHYEPILREQTLRNL